jgi:hypothetical protein
MWRLVNCICVTAGVLVEGAGADFASTAITCNASSTTPFIWFNSPHLADTLPVEVTGVGYAHPHAPFSERPRRVLENLHAKGLTVETLFADPRLMASVVLACLPASNHVVPTEEYFYFELYFDGQWIAGNLRTTDSHNGILHLGYYMRDNVRESAYMALDARTQMCVSSSVDDTGVKTVLVNDEFTDSTVTFTVIDPAHLPFASIAPLAPDEVLLSPIIDESGVAFWLVFDTQTCAFTYILYAKSVPPMRFVQVSSCVSVDSVSGFAFHHRWPGRKDLVAVRSSEVLNNTFFDGPFDQVPPRLPLRELIRSAFPGVEEARGGVLDPYGNWVGDEGLRVAIAPYREHHSSAVLDILDYLPPMMDYCGFEIGVVDSGSSGPPEQSLQELRKSIEEYGSLWPPGHDLFQSFRAQAKP